MRRMLNGLVVFAGLAVFVLAAAARADEEKVPLDKVPKAVLDGVKARFPDAKLVSAEKEKERDKTVYEIAITNKDQKIEVTLTPDGKIVEIENQIAAKDMPKVVTEALEAKYPQATYKMIEEVIKVKDGEEKLEYYEVLLVTAEKKKLEVSVSPKGKITKVEDKSKEKGE
jgi:Putative beta-lactamase-inhibitor-like, PepSY-like